MENILKTIGMLCNAKWHIGDCSVFSANTAAIANTKEQHLNPTYYPYFLTSLL